MKVLLASTQHQNPALLARHLAARLGTRSLELDVLTVIPGVEGLAHQQETHSSNVIGITEGDWDYHHACAHVATLSEQLRQHGFTQVRTHVEYGDPADIILTSSRQWRSQLLLIGAPTRRGLLTAFRIDGVTRRLLASADCPVELIRPEGAKHDPRQILLPVTAAALPRLPLSSLQGLPWQEGDQLHLLCSLPPAFDESRTEASPAAVLLALQEERDLRTRTLDRLQLLQNEMEAMLPGYISLSHEVVEGAIGALTIRAARERQPGLVLLSSACLSDRSNSRGESRDEPPTALALSLPTSVLLLPDEALALRPQRQLGQARILRFAR